MICLSRKICILLILEWSCTTCQAFVSPPSVNSIPIRSTSIADYLRTFHHHEPEQPTPSRFIRARRIRLAAVAVPPSNSAVVVGPHIAIDENYPGLKRVHANPNIYVLEDFLNEDACNDMMAQASTKSMAQSPVAYAGWTQDFQELFELAAKGPVAWIALLTAWWQVQHNVDGVAASQVTLVLHAVQNYLVILVLATTAIAAFTKSRADGLQALRTSTSTTLDDLEASVGAREFCQRAAALFGDQESASRAASFFEAPTIIRYEAGQQLAAHFDANRSASVEDANRGGQTLATLLVYLNEVPQGGLTRFGRLQAADHDNSGKTAGLTIQPKRGDALLFFPADAAGRFDERTEHEGCPAVDEKWIARIWRREKEVPPPFGLRSTELARLDQES